MIDRAAETGRPPGDKEGSFDEGRLFYATAA